MIDQALEVLVETAEVDEQEEEEDNLSKQEEEENVSKQGEGEP